MLRFRLLARGVVAASLFLGVVSTPAHAADPVVAAAGDISCDPTSLSFNNGNGTSDKCRQKYTSNLLVDQGLAAVLPLGDNQYEFGTLQEFQLSYDLSWGQVKSITRPAIGNHEYDLLAGDGYFDYFNGVGNYTGPAGDRDKGYYSFDVGDWHLVALNSMCIKINGCQAGSPQERWLRADLAANADTSCTLAYWHHPLFSSGTEGVEEHSDTTDLWQALYEGGAELVLNGHEHLYERFAPQTALGVADSEYGLREFIVGTGGKSLHDLGPTAVNSQVRDNAHFGVIKIVLHPQGYSWSFVTETGAVRDSGSASCHDAPDLTPPETSISAGPQGLVKERTASFSFASSEDGSSFQCSLDGAAFAGCTSPKSYSNLGDGPHTFKARATDAAGNEDPSPATRTFTVDGTAPDTSISSGPSGLTNDRSASFSFASSETGSSFECSLDGATFAGCTSPRSYGGLADGTYSFRVRAVDAAGNSDESPATRTFTVDGSAPQTSISGGPQGLTNDRDASFSFSSSETGSSFQCSLDGAAFASCSSPKAYANLDDGSHTFATRATDAAGNTDPSPATRTFTVDATAPDTSISGGPSGTINTASATFTFAASESGASLECSLDGAAFASCSSPKTYADLDDGSHTFRTRATDAAGNTDPTAAARTFSVDTTPPDTSISGGPTGTINTATATFTFAASEGGASLECSLDGAAFASCTSPKTYTNLDDGSHTFAARATDAAGNTDPSPATRTFTVDDLAPGTAISDGPSGTINTASATFSFAADEDGASLECSLDGAAFAGCTSPMSYGNLAEGSHTFAARATDAVGNADQSPATRTFTVDTTAPETSITGGPSGKISVTSAAFTFGASEAGSSFECRLDGATWASCTSAWLYAGLAEGSHTLEVRATDPVGNTDLSPAARTFTVELPVEPTPDPVDPAPDPEERPTTLPDSVGDLDSLKHYRVGERDIVSGRAHLRRGSKRRLWADDGERLEIAAERKRSGVFVSQFEASMAIGRDVRDALGSLTLSYNGGTSARKATVKVFVFNYRSDRWVKAFAHRGRRDRSLEWSASAFAPDYVSKKGTFSVRVKGKRGKAFRTRTDLLELTVES